MYNFNTIKTLHGYTIKWWLGPTNFVIWSIKYNSNDTIFRSQYCSPLCFVLFNKYNSFIEPLRLAYIKYYVAHNMLIIWNVENYGAMMPKRFKLLQLQTMYSCYCTPLDSEWFKKNSYCGIKLLKIPYAWK